MSSSNVTRPELSFTFTRPANITAYAAGQQVANSTTAGSVTPIKFTHPISSGRGFLVQSATLTKSTTTILNADFRLHLFRENIAAQFGDGAAASPTYADLQKCVGTILFANAGHIVQYTNGVFYGGLFMAAAACPQIAVPNLTDGNVYGLLIATAAYAPGNAESFTIRLSVMAD